MTDTATAIRTLRTRRAWSQDHLAAAAGVSARTIQRIERGRPAAAETAIALAAALEVPVSDLWEPPGQPAAAPAAPAGRIDRLRAFRTSLLTFAAVMAGLTAVNLIRSPSHLWVIYPAIGWGIPLAIKGIRLRSTRPL